MRNYNEIYSDFNDGKLVDNNELLFVLNQHGRIDLRQLLASGVGTPIDNFWEVFDLVASDESNYYSHTKWDVYFYLPSRTLYKQEYEVTSYTTDNDFSNSSWTRVKPCIDAPINYKEV